LSYRERTSSRTDKTARHIESLSYRERTSSKDRVWVI